LQNLQQLDLEEPSYLSSLKVQKLRHMLEFVICSREFLEASTTLNNALFEELHANKNDPVQMDKARKMMVDVFFVSELVQEELDCDGRYQAEADSIRAQKQEEVGAGGK